MNHQDTMRLFVVPMRHAFEETPGENEAAFFKTLCEDLADATEYQLVEAAKFIRKTRSARSFPTIAACLMAIAAIPVAPTAEASEKIQSGRDRAMNDPNSRLREAEADELCRSFRWSCEAARAGWLLGLWDFCRHERRHPDGAEMQKIKRTAKLVEERIGDLQTGSFNVGSMRDACLSLGMGILDKRDAIVKRVFPFGAQEVAAE